MLYLIIHRVYKMFDWFAGDSFRCSSALCLLFLCVAQFNTPILYYDVLSAVKSFAKQTGDYGFLSVTDLKVLALTYDLEKQYNGVEHLNKEPSRKVCLLFKYKMIMT